MACYGGNAGGILQHLGQRVPGETHEFEQAARFHVGEGVLLQTSEIDAEFEHVAAAIPDGIVNQFERVGRVPLRIIDIVAQGGEA